jgi:predicted porin
MKKILMATLLMGLVSVASAQVKLSGKVSQFVDNSEIGVNKSTQLVTEPTSNFALSVNEKLANGLTARAVIETSLRGNTIDGDGTKIGDRQSTVGLATSFGSVDFGRNVHSHFLAITSNDVFGTLYGSVAGDVHNLRGLRLGDAVFVTVSPAKNLSVAFEKSQAAGGADATVYGANTKMGPVSLTATRFESGVEKSTVVGLGTQVANTKLHYVYSDNTGLVNNKGHLVGAAQRFGSVTAKASWGKNSDDVKAYAVGADYHLSKRTDLTVAYRNVDRSSVPSIGDVSQIGVGVTHRF